MESPSLFAVSGEVKRVFESGFQTLWKEQQVEPEAGLSAPPNANLPRNLRRGGNANHWDDQGNTLPGGNRSRKCWWKRAAGGVSTTVESGAPRPGGPYPPLSVHPSRPPRWGLGGADEEPV